MSVAIEYRDDELVVAVKPAGLLSVPGRGPDKQDCLWRRVQQEFPTARIVHRLDCATSGLMVLALSADVHRELSRQFHDRQTRKAYTAIVAGRPAQDSGTVELPLRCDWERRPLQIVDPVDGKTARTDWQLLDSDGDTSRIRLYPITGRSHQLRVHMQALGHPILGDAFYAPPAIRALSPRLMLHAQELGFRHPVSGEAMDFVSPAPF
ncbi:pseudouridine synthase [Marinobacterium nitratireducens]|uniref:Dual-specificity RNA pseudouridine synthase RluA n=1 Tax=Marinobacterium nitratireducens TaxID=518897 RepID=A0A918DS26_9GAMM|nr:pseudouridine synthase [Marinobacterium nitratireducens]GGO80638.1 pseudouridine synthase [Marinobacterium nitratireducens]